MDNLTGKSDIFELKITEGSRADLAEIFGNENPVYLEIGSGRGEFLLSKAEQNPQVNFLALELKEKRIKTILRNLEQGVHDNVRIARIFVDDKISKLINPGSFKGIYIIHPDPWPKRKHHKNRIIQQRFISVLWTLLQPEGEIFLSTDHQEYAEWIVEHFAKRKDFANLYPGGWSSTPPEDHTETFFEKKKRKEGFKPYFMRYVKVIPELE